MKKICRERVEFSLAAEQVGSNEDLLREIFLRLPVRCLVKCKVVSKAWSSFISDPVFVKDYSKGKIFKSNIPSGLYFYNSFNKGTEIESVSLEDGPNQSSGIGVPSLSFLQDVISPGGIIKILQSCHGLLLCEITCLSSSGVVVNYIVCNPTTRKYKIIPLPSLQPTQSIVAMSLGFDPSESLHYKLVCVKHIRSYNDHGWHTHNMEVYSSETGFWRSTSCSFRRYDSARFENAFYWNGTTHWLRYEVGYFCLLDEFNFKTEKLEIIHLPPQPRGDCYCKWAIRYFGQSRGYWHLIYIRSLSAYQFNILEMDKDTFKWSVKYRVNIYRLLSKFPETVRDVGPDQYRDADKRDKLYAFSILSFIKGEKDEDSELVFIIPGKVVSYKIKHKTIEVLRDLPSQVVDSSTFGFINSHQFVGSLFSV